MRRIKNIVVHWSASPKTWGVSNLRDHHVNNNGWRDIGYHRVIIHPSSNEARTHTDFWWELVKQGRHLDNDLYLDITEQGAHALGYNKNSVGICVIGNTDYSFHPWQQVALLMTLQTFLTRFDLDADAIKCHRDVNTTLCPGEEIYNLVESFKRASS